MDHSNISSGMSTECKTDVVIDDCITKNFDMCELRTLRNMIKVNPKIDPRITICSSWKGSYPLPKIGEAEE